MLAIPSLLHGEEHVALASQVIWQLMISELRFFLLLIMWFRPSHHQPIRVVMTQRLSLRWVTNFGLVTLFTDVLGNTLNVVQLGPNGGSFNQTVVLPSDTLLPLGGNTMSLTVGPIDMSIAGTYDFIAFVNNQDVNPFNDTLTYQ